MARFGDEALCGYDQPFPIVCIRIRPRGERFSDALTHRDFLGALMHIGVTRECIGDVVLDGNTAYAFCADAVAPVVLSSLTRVKRTAVDCDAVDALPVAAAPALTPETVLLSSVRLDGVIARVFRLPREESASLIRTGRVFLDGAACDSASAVPKAGCIVSVRGYGRFRMGEVTGESKKGKLRLTVERYDG